MSKAQHTQSRHWQLELNQKPLPKLYHHLFRNICKKDHIWSWICSAAKKTDFQSQLTMSHDANNNQIHFSPRAEGEASKVKVIENLISWIDNEFIFDFPKHVFTVFQNINGEINYRSSQNHNEIGTVTIASRQSHCFPAFPSFSSWWPSSSSLSRACSIHHHHIVMTIMISLYSLLVTIIIIIITSFSLLNVGKRK